MALVGLPILVWWLHSVSSGPESYAIFVSFATSIFGRIILIGISFSFFQHLASGLRHFVMDIGAGYELKTARRTSFATFAFSVFCTSAFWIYILFLK
jgi:succinate dehydrogenase / fumarate reductase cytochrome b subunit